MRMGTCVEQEIPGRHSSPHHSSGTFIGPGLGADSGMKGNIPESQSFLNKGPRRAALH